MSQLLTELRKSQTVALDEARGASAGGFGPIRGGAEIDVDAVRLALEALHDGLETERQRLAQEAARTQAGKGSFELDRQNLDELMEALRHEQEQQEHRRMQRKPELPVDEFVLADDPLLDNAGEQQTFQEQETVVMSNSSRAAEAATEAELSAASTVTAACCTPNCPVDTPDDGTDENLLAAVEAPHDEQRAEMESLRVVANDSARRAIRRHSWKQRLSAYGMVLALSSASAILMLWAWGGLAAGTVSSLAWGAGAVSLIASLSFGFDARRKNRIRKSLARRV